MVRSGSARKIGLQRKWPSSTFQSNMLRRLATLIVTLFLSTAAVAQEAAPDAEELTKLLTYFLDGASRNDIAAHERF